MKKELKNNYGKIFLTITFEAENNWVYNNWFGSQSQENVRLGANTCLEILMQNHCSYLINDNRLVAGPWSQATDWLLTNWLPRAIAGGLTYFAHITSLEPLARLSAENLRNHLVGNLQMEIFEDVPRAEAWLKAKQQLKNHE
ncbi:STAS/SEC14 domain-containing protein [Adhaeribacter swui]|uniref:STAS/SEC14 domain-containing protein n=1 Tax=Adhaeribacter swui TaxID=2086471 RepID=A0A7G7G639_9BACT|nr:STAS/SEC14 domain-containing protein [Adhaeribacter swui]QNF32623.1 STAS/SEC14 domain-containing protein [Adhaeribacter swui]